MAKNSFAFIFIFWSIVSVAQINRYAVFFEDKDTLSFQTADPLIFLSSRAIDRRAKQNIPITIEDCIILLNG